MHGLFLTVAYGIVGLNNSQCAGSYRSITGRLTGEKDDISQLPVQNLGPNAAKLTPLWQLLNLATPFPDPQTWQELNHSTPPLSKKLVFGLLQ
jgi:hypothetical protein